MESLDSYPLISCICVTKNDPVLLSRAIKCFEAQTYPNRELVVLYQEYNFKAHDLLKGYRNNPVIKILSAGQHLALGALRNYAVENSTGDFFCQWDDDDWYSALRLESQYICLVEHGYPACVMDQWIIFDSLSGQSYISCRRLWEGSLLCKKDLFFEKKYENISRGEDTPFVEYLFDNELLYVLSGVPGLYIYNYHGKNTFGPDHFNDHFEEGTLITDQWNAEINKILRLEYDVAEGSGILNAIN